MNFYINGTGCYCYLGFEFDRIADLRIIALAIFLRAVFFNRLFDGIFLILLVNSNRSLRRRGLYHRTGTECGGYNIVTGLREFDFTGIRSLCDCHRSCGRNMIVCRILCCGIYKFREIAFPAPCRLIGLCRCHIPLQIYCIDCLKRICLGKCRPCSIHRIAKCFRICGIIDIQIQHLER